MFYVDVMLSSLLLNTLKSLISLDPPNDPEQPLGWGHKNDSVIIATHVLTAYGVSGTVLSTLHPSSHLMLSAAP